MSIKLGILGFSSFFQKKVTPSLNKNKNIKIVAIGSHKENLSVNEDITIYRNYSDLLLDTMIDAVYIPLPNSMHFEWAKKVLENNKHVIVEKPLATSLDQAKELIDIANQRNLIIMETFQFRFHKQITFIKNILANNSLGELKKIDIKFGIPMLKSNDIRFKKELDGGAYFDLGVYGLRMINELFGVTSINPIGKLLFYEDFKVDMGGNLKFYVDETVPVEFDFGFDNEYQCSLEIWGSKGILSNKRIFTAPPDLKINTQLKLNNQANENFIIDDQIKNLFDHFASLIINRDKELIEKEYSFILNQAYLVESTLNKLVNND